jgi:hypothetical protein
MDIRIPPKRRDTGRVHGGKPLADSSQFLYQSRYKKWPWLPRKRGRSHGPRKAAFSPKPSLGSSRKLGKNLKHPRRLAAADVPRYCDRRTKYHMSIPLQQPALGVGSLCHAHPRPGLRRSAGRPSARYVTSDQRTDRPNRGTLPGLLTPPGYSPIGAREKPNLGLAQAPQPAPTRAVSSPSLGQGGTPTNVQPGIK